MWSTVDAVVVVSGTVVGTLDDSVVSVVGTVVDGFEATTRGRDAIVRVPVERDRRDRGRGDDRDDDRDRGCERDGDGADVRADDRFRRSLGDGRPSLGRKIFHHHSSSRRSNVGPSAVRKRVTARFRCDFTVPGATPSALATSASLMSTR